MDESVETWVRSQKKKKKDPKTKTREISFLGRVLSIWREAATLESSEIINNMVKRMRKQNKYLGT